MKLSTILKGILYLFIGLVLAALIVPFVFKDKIIEEITKITNENLNAIVSFDDVDASLLRSFPNLNIRLEGLEVIGKGPFEGVSLLKTDVFTFDMNISPLYDDSVEPEISYIGLTRPDINVIVLDAKTANYNITLPDTTASTGFYIKLNKYDITDGKIRYRDKDLALDLILEGLNHEGKGDFTQDVFDLATKSEAKSVYAKYDGFTYINKLPAKLDALINMNFPEEKYTLKDNKALLNKLELNGDGFVQFDGDNMLTQVKINCPSNSFGDLVSAFPFIPVEKGMDIKGNFSAKATADGIYNGVLGRYPAFDIDLSISDGSIKYTDLPYPINNINSKIHIKSTNPHMKDLIVDISDFGMKVNNELIKGKFTINNGLSDPLVEGSLDADVNLENWSKAIYIEGLEQIGGQIYSDIKFKGALSDIEAQNYDKIEFSGDFKGTKLLFKTTGSPAINITAASMSAKAERLVINTTGLKMGNSEMAINGTLDNPLAFLSEKINVKGNINVEADRIDFNEWISTEPATAAQSTSEETMINFDQYESTDVTVNATAKEIIYENYNLKNTKLKGNLGLSVIEISDFSTNIGESDISVVGKIVDPIGYMNNTSTLKGDLNFKSNNFNANQFMTSEEAVTVENGQNAMFEVPANIDMQIVADIKKLKYTDIDMSNFTGTLNVKDETIALNKINGQVLQGEITFDGLYDSKPEKPTFDTKLDLSKIKFHDAYEKFVSVRSLAPIAKFIEGFFNTTLVFSGEMGAGMVPNFSTLNASGFIETFNSTIKNANPIEEVANKLNIDKLKSLKLDNTKNWFEIKNGIVDFKERVFDYEGIGGKLKGTHQIQGDMDYNMILSIPREMLKGNKIANAAEKGLSFLESKAKGLGLNIDQGEYIDVKITMTGRLLSPKVTIVPLGSSGNSIKDELNSTVNNAIETVKDSITKEVNKKKEQLKDTLTKVAEKELDKAKEKAKKEADKAIEIAKEKAKKEAGKIIDSTVTKVVSDTLSQKVKDAIDKNTGTNVDEIKDKINDWNPFKKKKGN